MVKKINWDDQSPFNCMTKRGINTYQERSCELCHKKYKPRGASQKFCSNCQEIARKNKAKQRHLLIYIKQRRIKRNFNFRKILGKYNIGFRFNFRIKFRPKSWK